jgi:bifunctional DNA-binding transcriptional regulator/antitoxin component of YhaV-PrlF toxin-antitoxin module
VGFNGICHVSPPGPIAIFGNNPDMAHEQKGLFMGYDSQPIKMAANGRLSIPAKQRKALGLEKGGLVVSKVENGELRIRTVKAVMDELRAKIGPLLKAAGVSSDSVIAGRREEAASEEAKYQQYEKYRESLRGSHS